MPQISDSSDSDFYLCVTSLLICSTSSANLEIYWHISSCLEAKCSTDSANPDHKTQNESPLKNRTLLWISLFHLVDSIIFQGSVPGSFAWDYLSTYIQSLILSCFNSSEFLSSSLLYSCPSFTSWIFIYTWATVPPDCFFSLMFHPTHSFQINLCKYWFFNVKILLWKFQ